MASDVFVRFLEDKLAAAGVRKVVPPLDMLTETFTLFRRDATARRLIEERWEHIAADQIEAPPDDLEPRVREALKASPTTTWDEAVRSIARAAK